VVDSPDVVPAEIVAYRIERGRALQAPQLQAIERAAGARFREIGMADIADHEPTPVAIFEDRAAAGQLLVAHDDTGAIAGFLFWSAKDGMAYIEEVAVHTAHAGRRVGVQLIDRLAQDAHGRFPAITLTTFRDVPWNGPYYAKLGFKEFPRDQAGPEHAHSWQDQADDGLDMSRRLFMSRAVQ
jgi:GNAT superfamily N-acetyltransferase